MLRLQGGYIHGWGSDGLRMLDHFQMGPNLVRGFAPSGIGPRDMTPGTINDALRRLDLLGHKRRIPDAAVLRAQGIRHQARGVRTAVPVVSTTRCPCGNRSRHIGFNCRSMPMKTPIPM